MYFFYCVRFTGSILVCCKRIFLFYNAFDVYPAFVTISINSSAVCSCLDKIVTVLSSVFTLA